MGTTEPDRERFMSENPTPEAPAAEQTPATPEAPAAPEADKAPEKDWQAEAEKWKAFARKHEDAAKANADKAKRFDEFEESQKTEIEKLADRAAKAEAKAAEVELRALKAEVAAEKGVPAALLSGANLEELTAAADALLAFRGEKPKPDFGAGDRGTDVGSGRQWTQADLDRAKNNPEAIVQARKDGLLNDVMGIKR